MRTEADPPQEEPERRYTAPSGMDSSTTKFIETTPDPATEIISTPTEPILVQQTGCAADDSAARRRTHTTRPQTQLGLGGGAGPGDRRARRRCDTGHAAADPRLRFEGSRRRNRSARRSRTSTSRCRTGDLATLRSITCGATRDSYVNYDDRAWTDTHARVAAAKQYPVVASIDQVVVNGDHAEANVTTFMAYAPQTRSTRSFDLQFRDDQWKICQAP